MHKNIMIAVLGLSVLATTGCANGPVRRFFRGGACNACQPAVGQTLWGQDSDDNSSCPNGVCGQNQETLGGNVLPGPAQSQPGTDPNSSGVIYGQPNFDPFSGGQMVNPPAGGNVLPGPR